MLWTMADGPVHVVFIKLILATNHPHPSGRKVSEVIEEFAVSLSERVAGVLVGVERSLLLPTSMTVRLGDARPLASDRKVGREVKVECFGMSYTSRAPAAPR